MGALILLVIVVGVAVLAMAALQVLLRPRLKGVVSASGKLPYRRKDYLMTEAERSFLSALDVAAGPGRRVFAKVRLADLVWMGKGVEGRTGHQNRVNMKHVDFVVCDADTMRPLAAVELDDATHDRAKGRERDAFVDAALRAAGLPLVRIKAASHARGYAPAEIARQISLAIDGSSSAMPSGSPARPAQMKNGWVR